ncbi:RDD family protein [Mycobacterium intracellulare]|uniref:RDD family protein n=1 Tax=Mycobacterium intracellulare TaxID=1767 RepID=UPI00109E8EF1|nr:RDD family protein [Mycobacterium intracellulare]
MTADAATRATNASDDTKPAVLASWTARGGALALDFLPGVVVLATTALVALSVPPRGAWWWVSASTAAVTIVLTAFNRLLLPVLAGQTVGRAVFGITVVRRNGDAVGPWCLLLRDLAHLLDTAPALLGWLWPLWDSRRRTFADMLLGTQSRLTEARRADRTVRRLAAALVVTAASLCAGGAAISYSVVRQHDQSVTDARSRIARQGPHMVEAILSYHPETIEGDFERARSLATDKYRAELSTQQQAVQKAGPVRNEYWVTNSAVLAATASRATMLVFLQGERGAPPDQRYLTASVRVTFVKPAAADWHVDDLAVVTKPQTAGAKP